MSSLKMWGAPRPVSSPQQVGRHPAGVSRALADSSWNRALNKAYPGHRYSSNILRLQVKHLKDY